MLRRHARVRELAVLARERGKDLRVTPEQLDELNRSEEIRETTIQWKLDPEPGEREGRTVEVLVVGVSGGAGQGRRPAKGGMRYVLNPGLIETKPFREAWERFRQTQPSRPEARRGLRQSQREVTRALSLGMRKVFLVGLGRWLRNGKWLVVALDVDKDNQPAPFKEKYSQGELARLDAAVGERLTELGWVGPKVNVPATDVGSGEANMGRLAEANLRVQVKDHNSPLWLERRKLAHQLEGKIHQSRGEKVPLLRTAIRYALREGESVPELAVYTGKPVELGGSPLRADATGIGGLIVTLETVKRMDPNRAKKSHPLGDMTVAIQGFGKAGGSAAPYFAGAGTRIVVVSDLSGFLVKREGFSGKELEHLRWWTGVEKRLFSELSAKELSRLGAAFSSDSAEVVKSDVDLLILSATDLAVREDNAAFVQARYIAPLANGAVDPEAAAALARRGQTVLPDGWASAGAVIVSWLEMQQNFDGHRWRRREIRSLLQEWLLSAAGPLWKMWEELRELDPDVDLQTAGDFLADQQAVLCREEEDLPPPPEPRSIRRRAAAALAAAGLEGNEPAGSAALPEIEWLADLFPNTDRDKLYAAGTVYAFLRFRDVPAPLRDPAFQNALQEAGTDSWEYLPETVKHQVLENVLPHLRANVILPLGNGNGRAMEKRIPLRLEMANVYHREVGRAYRLRGRFEPPQDLPDGAYPYSVEVAVDGREEWKHRSGGYFYHGRGDGVPLSQQAAPDEAVATVEETLRALAELEGEPSAEKAQGLVRLFEKEILLWGVHPERRAVLAQSPRRDEFVQRAYSLLRRLAPFSDGRIVIREPPQRERRNIRVREGEIFLVAGSLNPTWNVEVEAARGDDGGLILQVLDGLPGGALVNMARATAAAGFPAEIVLLQRGDLGQRISDFLEREGVRVTAIPIGGTEAARETTARPSLIVRTEFGSEFRLTARGAGIQREMVISVADGVEQMIKGRFSTLVIGEQMPSSAMIGELRHQIQTSRALNRRLRVYFAPSDAWNMQELDRILTEGVDVVHFRADHLANVLGESGEAAVVWEKAAALAGQVLRRFAGVNQVLVSLATGQKVLVARDGESQLAWRSPLPPRRPDGPLFPYRTGQADVEFAHFRIALEEGLDEDGLSLPLQQALPRALNQAWRAGVAYRRLASVRRDRMPTLSQVKEVQEPLIEQVRLAETAGGLEERIRLRLSAWSEGRTMHGLLVVPERVLRDAPALNRLLRRLSDDLASSVVIWKETETTLDLAVRLAGFEQAGEGVGVLGDPAAAAGLEIHLAAFGIPSGYVPLDWRAIGQALGVAGPVLDQAGLEQLQADLEKLHAA